MKRHIEPYKHTHAQAKKKKEKKAERECYLHMSRGSSNARLSVAIISPVRHQVLASVGWSDLGLVLCMVDPDHVGMFVDRVLSMGAHLKREKNNTRTKVLYPKAIRTPAFRA
jgi:hypothetical protein